MQKPPSARSRSPIKGQKAAYGKAPVLISQRLAHFSSRALYFLRALSRAVSSFVIRLSPSACKARRSASRARRLASMSARLCLRLAAACSSAIWAASSFARLGRGTFFLGVGAMGGASAFATFSVDIRLLFGRLRCGGDFGSAASKWSAALPRLTLITTPGFASGSPISLGSVTFSAIPRAKRSASDPHAASAAF